jgi:hypothetical protein
MMIASGHPHTPSNTRCTRRPQVRSCERPLVNANVDMAVFCQVGTPVPPHPHHEFLSVPALSGLSVLQVRLAGGTAF